MKYLLNISTGVIHDADNPCYQGRIMNESNKKYLIRKKRLSTIMKVMKIRGENAADALIYKHT